MKVLLEHSFYTSLNGWYRGSRMKTRKGKRISILVDNQAHVERNCAQGIGAPLHLGVEMKRLRK